MYEGCPYCGSLAVNYLGVDDGGGPHGTSQCDYWHCDDCCAEWEDDCMELDGMVGNEMGRETFDD